MATIEEVRDAVQQFKSKAIADGGRSTVSGPQDIYAGKELQDSGERRTFETGAQRDRQAGKGRFDLLPPTAIRALARVFEEGARKYECRGWEKGMPLCNYIDSALRHISDHMEGKRDEPHIAQACWNLVAYLHTATMIQRGLLPEDLNDLPNHMAKEKPSVL